MSLPGQQHADHCPRPFSRRICPRPAADSSRRDLGFSTKLPTVWKLATVEKALPGEFSCDNMLMNRSDPSLNASRQSRAAAIWSLLLILMVLPPAEISNVAAVVCVLGVSMASAVALLLVDAPSRDTRTSNWHRQTSLVISFVVPLTWCLHFGLRNSALVGMMFTMVTLIPIVVTRVCLLARSSTVDMVDIRGKTSAEPPVPTQAAQSIPGINDEPASLIHDDFEPIDSIPMDLPLVESEDRMSSDVTQWLTRTLTTEGEIIEGGIRIEFADGQRDATVHVSFCPPLCGVPEVTTEDLDGCELEIRVAAVFPFGVRISVRRMSNSLSDGIRNPAETCRIGFVAAAASVRRAA